MLGNVLFIYLFGLIVGTKANKEFEERERYRIRNFHIVGKNYGKEKQCMNM